MHSFRNWQFTVSLCVACLAIASYQKFVAAKDVETAPAASVAAPTIDATRIPKLIQLLGDPQYTVRETAQADLARFGVDAFDALTEAANHSDIEIASRANYLLRLILIQIESDADSPQVKRILQGYSLTDAEGRFAKALKLAGLMHNEGLAPLCRLVRYEKSLLMSKQCALLILGQTTANAEERAQRAKIIDRELATSDRPGAGWLRCYLLLESDPDAALAQWQKYFDTEVATLRKTERETSSDVVMALGRHEADWLQERGRKDDATAVMRKMVSVERGNPATLLELSDWLLQMDAVVPQAELVSRFTTAFRADPKLYYFIAETRRREGNTEESEKIAKLASDAIGADSLTERLQLAATLQGRGLFVWAEREYRRLIEAAKAEEPSKESEESIGGRFYCSSMLHDLGRDKEAAELLKPIVEAINADPNIAQALQSATPLTSNELRARVNFYTACHFQSVGDAEQEWTFLKNARVLSPQDGDVLIAMYKATAKDKSQRQEVVEYIEQTAEQLTRRINSQPDDEAAYNEYAWLIGNTVGDYEKAITYSQKSIDMTMERRRDLDGYDETLSLWPGSLDREPAAFIDTLAHCYAGKGDYENAVKFQAHAAKLEPHSMAIVQALDEFKAKLKSSRGKN
jgi:tetratricopeptide (TPR) repeat protein